MYRLVYGFIFIGLAFFKKCCIWNSHSSSTNELKAMNGNKLCIPQRPIRQSSQRDARGISLRLTYTGLYRIPNVHFWKEHATVIYERSPLNGLDEYNSKNQLVPTPMRNVIKAVGYTNTKSSIYKSTICRTKSITSLYYREKSVRPSICRFL